MVASKTGKLAGNLLRYPHGERLSKSMALLGPNASGKTTFLEALYRLRQFVLFSTREQNPQEGIRFFEPFALDKRAISQPTVIEVTFDVENRRYLYVVGAGRERVWREELSVRALPGKSGRWPKSRVLIRREWDSAKNSYGVTLASALGSESLRTTAEEQTPGNRLILGKLAAVNSEVASEVLNWFHRDLHFSDFHRNTPGERTKLEQAARLVQKDAVFAAGLARMVQDADTGIHQISTVEEHVREVHVQGNKDEIEFRDRATAHLVFHHLDAAGGEVTFPWHLESSGTLRFVALLTAVLEPTVHRRLLCVDELSASLHPELVKRLLAIVHSKEHNPMGHQLIFTTHDTHVLNPGEVLRRDQVAVFEKDGSGQSLLTRLDTFQDDARSDANLQKQYLQGRFGGLPVFGPTLEDVTSDEDPLQVIQ